MRRQPEGKGAVAEDRDDGEPTGDVERDQRGDHAALDPADAPGQRQQVAEHPDEVGHHEDRDGRRLAEGVEASPQDSDVESPPGDGAEQRRVARAREGDRAADAPGDAGGRAGHRPDDAREALPGSQPRAHAIVEVARQQCGGQRHGNHTAGEHRRHDGQPEGRRPGQNARAQPHTAEDQRRHEDRVERHVEGREPLDELATPHARARQGPGRQGDPPGACRGEDTRGRHPGHRDLVARPPVERRVAPHEDAAKQHHVAGVRARLQEHGGGEPPGVAALEAPPGVVEPGDARQADVQADHQCDHEQRPDHHLPAAARLGLHGRRAYEAARSVWTTDTNGPTLPMAAGPARRTFRV